MSRRYRTSQGDTWDLIALRMYPDLGGEKLMDVLLAANTEYQDYVILPANLVLEVPDVAVPIVTTLPPWKRGGPRRWAFCRVI